MEPNLDSLRRLAAEMVLDLAERMGDLTDEEVQPLMSWALGQAEIAAQSVLTTHQSESLPPVERSDRLAAMLKPVGQVITMINDLIADRDILSLEEITEKVEFLRQQAQQLPCPLTSGAMDLAPCVHSFWGSELSNKDLMYLFTGLCRPDKIGQPQLWP